MTTECRCRRHGSAHGAAIWASSRTVTQAAGLRVVLAVRIALPVWWLGCLDGAVDDLADASGCVAGVWLPGVEPGDDGFGREGGDQAGGPVQPGPGRYLRGQVATGDLGGGGSQGIGLVAELWLAGGVLE